jgi:Ca-activated chloride channel family protein
VFPSVDLGTLTFAQPFYLQLLVVPGALMLVLVWRFLRRRADIKRLARAHVSPVSARYPRIGDLGFWFFVLLASSLCISALARPQARVTGVTRGGIDIIFLQDGSASMYVRDSKPDRWRRSIRFLRTFADSLGWRNGDRAALALFAHIAAPQLRLTSDPNALFFFLDHLGERSPFRLEDDPTWDTNIMEGIYWGLQLIARDESLFGGKPNAKAFVVVTDGQAWSGDVRVAIDAVRASEIPIYVVGIGTTTGGVIPEPVGAQPAQEPFRSSLDRDSLRAIATAGGGDYFEIDRQPDREIALTIMRAVRGRTPAAQIEESSRDIYQGFLVAAGALLCVGMLMVRQRAELWWQVAGIAAALAIVLLAL